MPQNTSKTDDTLKSVFASDDNQNDVVYSLTLWTPWLIATLGKADFYPASKMKKQLSRISLLQSSKVLTALYFLMGFIYTLIGMPMIIFGGPKFRVMGYVYLFMPILMAVIGFVFVLLFGAAYNFLAKRLGGIEVEITTIE